MADELFDLYDEKDNALGETKLRSEVHRDGDWHRVVHIYIMNLQGELLVHFRSPHKDAHPSEWDLRFGGHVSVGNNYDETAVRELQEEIGLTVDTQDLHVLGQSSHQHDNGKDSEHTKSYYYLFTGDDSELHFNDGEVVEVKWMSPELILAAMHAKPEQWVTQANHFEEILSLFKNI